jgi:hypothetical protein
MNEILIFDEYRDPDSDLEKYSYHLVEDNDTCAHQACPIERREANIYIFKFYEDHDTERSFTIACYTLDEALHTFVNMYRSVKDFDVTIKE